MQSYYWLSLGDLFELVLEAILTDKQEINNSEAYECEIGKH